MKFLLRPTSLYLAISLAFLPAGQAMAAQTQALVPQGKAFPLVATGTPLQLQALSVSPSVLPTLDTGRILELRAPSPLEASSVSAEPDRTLLPGLSVGARKNLILNPAPQASNTARKQMRAAQAILGAGAKAWGTWNSFWQGARPASRNSNAIPNAGESAKPASPLARPIRGPRVDPAAPPTPAEARTSLLAGAFLGPAAVWAPAFYAALPYLKAGAAAFTAILLMRAAGKILDRIWSSKQWDRNILIRARFMIQMGLAVIGMSTTLELGGVEWHTLLTSMGLGGIIIGVPLKEFLDNPIKCAILRFNWQFDIGQRLRIKDKEYTIIGATLDDLALQAKEGEYALISYGQILSNVVELFVPPNLGRRISLREQIAAQASLLLNLIGAWNWALLVLGLVSVGVVLHLLGVSVAPLVASLGVLGVALSFAFGSIMGNIAASMRILLANRQFRIGDEIEVAGKRGTVTDITYTFVVLKASDPNAPQTILIPHGVLKDSIRTIFRKYTSARPTL